MRPPSRIRTTPAAAPEVRRDAWVRVAPDPSLEDLRAMPAGSARRDAVIDRLRAATAAGLEPTRVALEGALATRAPGARVATAGELWIDGSARMTVTVPGGGADTARIVDEVLASRGARVLDEQPLGGGQLEPAARTAAGADTGALDERQWFDGVLGFAAARERGLDGSGVRVAVVDSGVDQTHPDLITALERGGVVDRFTGSPIRSGHGTFVAGILAGARTGIAPGVDLLATRTYSDSFGDHGGASEATRASQRFLAMRALQDALAPPGGQQGADILVTSWGILDAPGVPAHDYDRTMSAIAAAGAVVVAAAGNDGAASDAGGTIAVPAQLDDVLAVGGIDRDGRWHPRASAGPSPRTARPKPEVAAPVVDVRSTMLGGGFTDTSGQADRGFAGTSAAAPITAGALAVLAQAVRRLGGGAAPDLDEVRSVLELLAIDVDSPGVDARTGAGVISVRRVDEAAARIVEARRT